MAQRQSDEATALASFGIKRFNSKKFENTDHDIHVRTPLEAAGINAAMTALHVAIPDVFSVEELSQPSEVNERIGLSF